VLLAVASTVFTGVLSSPPAHANDGVFKWVGGDGAALAPLDKTPIKMVEEVVVLEQQAEGWQVYCKFVFRNTSKEKQEVTVGFPFQIVPKSHSVAYQLDGKDLKPGEPLVADFRVVVDGSQVKGVKRVKLEKSKRLDLDGHELYAWDVGFDPDETVVIENTYRLGESWSSNRGPIHETSDATVNYVLQTGSLWKGGKIGRSHIELRTRRGEFPCDPERITPKGAQVERRIDGSYVIRWDLKDFTPAADDDLSVGICHEPEIGSDVINLYLTSTVDGLGDYYLESGKDLDKLLQEMRKERNLLYAKYGYEFKSKDLREYFSKKPWYSPNPGFKPSMLTEDEVETVKMIKQIEARLREELAKKKPE
jgi:hypothetical protein